MREGGFLQKTLRELSRALLFFLLVAFLVTCTMSLFVSTLSNDLGLVLTGENLNGAAKLTFWNVVALSALFTLIDLLRRKLITERITRRIVAAARELMEGNFSVRIEPVGMFAAEEHYGEIIDCFNKMAQELGGLETLRTDFVATVSHEMKTPLAVMQNYGTLLQAPELPREKRLAYARGVTDGVRRMTDMMANILQLNRLENQQIYPPRTAFDLGEQLCECLLQYENVWEEKEIEIETQIEENVTVQAERELLELVWNNLFSNAFKFTAAHGRVCVCLRADETSAVVEVRDSGCGMSAEVGSHIFEKFYQGDSSRATEGNGLGLALVKRVMDIVGGEISVESTVGVGTSFRVSIRRG